MGSPPIGKHKINFFDSVPYKEGALGFLVLWIWPIFA